MQHNITQLEAALRAASFALNGIPNTRLHGHAREKSSYAVASIIDAALLELMAPRFSRYGWTTGTRTLCGDTVHGYTDEAGNYEPWLADTKADAETSLAEDLRDRIDAYREDGDPDLMEEADALEEDGDDEDFLAYVGIDEAGNVHELDELTGLPTGFRFQRGDE